MYHYTNYNLLGETYARKHDLCICLMFGHFLRFKRCKAKTYIFCDPQPTPKVIYVVALK